jgi:hypothetical protein
MTAAVRQQTRRHSTRLLIGLIFLGSLALVALPVAWIWLAALIGGTYSTIFWLSLLGCPATIFAGGSALGRLNRIYLRLTNADELNDQPMRRRSPLEVSLVIAVLLAAALLVIWIIVVAPQAANQNGPFPD